MSFFNKKEEVLDVQLTQLGKYLLSKGTFKPMYYVFSDDEILYSTKFAFGGGGKQELKKEPSERIQKDTQRLKTLYNWEGVETRILKLNGHEIRDKESFPSYRARKTGRYGKQLNEDNMNPEPRNIVRNFLGHSTPGEQLAPTWDIESLLDGEMVKFNISSSTANIGIKRPVIDMEVEYKLEANKFTLLEGQVAKNPEAFNTQTGLEEVITFCDNYHLKVDNDVIILSVTEENVDYDRKNFELELFEIENVFVRKVKDPSSGELVRIFDEQLRRLYFSENLNAPNVNDVRYAEYYFDFLTDRDMADLYGIDIFGTQRQKLKDLVKAAVSGQLAKEDIDSSYQEGFEDFDEIYDECDDEGGY